MNPTGNKVKIMQSNLRLMEVGRLRPARVNLWCRKERL